MGDDMGYADLSCYGQRSYITKNLDKLAKQGVLLTNHYSNSPVCSQTRVAFNTGRYQQRLPVGNMEPLFYSEDMGDPNNPDSPFNKIGIPGNYGTIATRLTQAGYHTALYGKWHCGYSGALNTFGPIKNGYEEFYGFLSGGVHHFTHKDDYDKRDLWNGESPVDASENFGTYDTDLLTDKAVEFIRARKKDKTPFFLNLAYHSTHWPWLGPDDKDHPQNAPYPFALEAFNYGAPDTYAKQVISLDDGVGKVLKALEATGLARNTIVVFVSDNGGERYSNVWPFIGSKGHLYEGGIRVPGIVRWPGVFPRNKKSAQVSITMDWTATFLAAAGTSLDPADGPIDDGIDLTPILMQAGSKNEELQSRTLFWRFKGQHAVRDGNLKYLLMPESYVINVTDMPDPRHPFTPAGADGDDEIGTEYLFDLSKDQREQANQANSYIKKWIDPSAEPPAAFATLKEKFDEWNTEMLPENSAALKLNARM
jgi:arylsulfatase A-like enzyme